MTSRPDRAKSGSNFFEKLMKGGIRKAPGRAPGATPRPLSDTDFGYTTTGTTGLGMGEVAGEYQRIVDEMGEKELVRAFNKLLDDMNLTAAKRQPLQEMPTDQKRQILVMHHNAHQDTTARGRFDRPRQYVDYLDGCLGDALSASKLFQCVESLRIALTNNTLTWVNEFGDDGMEMLFRVLNVATDHNREPKYERVQSECLKCLLKFTNNTEGLKAFLKNGAGHRYVARCIDYDKPQVASLALQMLAALCFLRDDAAKCIGTEKALLAVTEVADERAGGGGGGVERFAIITDCMTRTRNDELWASCLKFVNALLTQSDELEMRVHLRNEIVRNGLHEMLAADALRKQATPAVQTQYQIFVSDRDEDGDELNHRFQDVRIELDDVHDCFELLKNVTLHTPAEPYFLSILQHLLFVRDDHLVRPAYYKLIEEVVSQIVLQRTGIDPDFSKRRLSIDVQNLVDEIKDSAPPPSMAAAHTHLEARCDELQRQLEEALAAKEEALARLEIVEVRKAAAAGVETKPPSKIQNTGFAPPPPPPLPQPLAQSGGGPGIPPPPPMPGGRGSGVPPPPPPPPPGSGIAPPPPPPPVPGGGFAPPPPAPPGASLPAGLQPKKRWEVSAPLKKANWKSIVPQRLTEKAFWFRVKEEELASKEILDGLATRFASKPKRGRQATSDAANIGSGGECGTLKKNRALRVLDAKTAQNLSILLGGGLKHMRYADIKTCVLRCDERVLSGSVLEQLIQYLPPPDQLAQLRQLRADDAAALTEAEQFCVQLAEVKRLSARLRSLHFRHNYAELVADIRPEIVAATAACQEVRRSAKFAKMLELILLLGNYMNTGSHNAQAFGFEMSFLAKMAGTKDADNRSTLLHYVAETVDRQWPEVAAFGDELPHVDAASRVSPDALQKQLAQMDRELRALDADLQQHRTPQCEDDRFAAAMGAFARDARDQCAVLQNMRAKMDAVYAELADYYVFDRHKYTLDEFFGDLKTFKDGFAEARRDNERERELAAKSERAREARRKADEEKREREARKRALIDMNPSETQEGVMDSLLEALHTGTAFSREQRRQRAPRLAGADRRAQLIRSRSRTNVLPPGRDLREIVA